MARLRRLSRTLAPSPSLDYPILVFAYLGVHVPNEVLRELSLVRISNLTVFCPTLSGWDGKSPVQGYNFSITLRQIRTSARRSATVAQGRPRVSSPLDIGEFPPPFWGL